MNDIILVTGGAGYIGSHTCKKLYDSGYTPVVVDNMIFGHKWAVKWGPLEECDLLDTDSLDKIFKKYSPAAVIHFAGYTHVANSIKIPSRYYENNVIGTLSLLKTMCRNDCTRLVFSSSCAIYGIPETNPINEEIPSSPISPYGATKLMVERILRDFDQAYGVRYISLRYFNAAGADPDSVIGEAHNAETHLIPLSIKTIMCKGRALSIYGTDYPTKDGTAVRDYIHVYDLALGHINSLKKLAEGQKSEIINLGSGKGYSVLEIAESISQISGKPLYVEYCDRRAGDPPVLISSIEKAKKTLDWDLKFSDLDTIISSAWNWHLKYEQTGCSKL